MSKLADTVAQLAAMRSAASRTAPNARDRLRDLTGFGSNPGALRCRTYVPDQLAERPVLVVVLHGCTQTAAAYDTGSGWSQLADELGFVLIFPEQVRANNANLCFNWFSPDDSRRDHGEALSIRQMIAAVVDAQDIDPARIFVTGLSAGGAMASVMLATYPDVFAGGAIVAGLPYGCAGSIPEAFDRMRGQGGPRPEELGALARRASPHEGPWPTISVWHGDADATVSPRNADAIVAQWRALHGLAATPDAVEAVDGHVRRIWRDGLQREVIEDFRIVGMGHGTPLESLGDAPCGAPGPFMLQAGISSTRHIAAFWGLIDVRGTSSRAEPAPDRASADVAATLPVVRTVRPERIGEPAPTRGPAPSEGVGAIIENALRAAGLMR